MELAIYYQYGNDPEKKYQTSADEVIIGRPKSIPIHLNLSPDLKVSRPHARLFYHLNCWWVQDLHSKHKTFLNGEIVTEETPLSPGDELQLGDTRLRVEFISLDTQRLHGSFDTYPPVDELESSPNLSQDAQIDLLAGVVRIVNDCPQGAEMCQSFIKEIAGAFPQADHITIILLDDDELLPVAYFPPGQAAQLSFTLVGRAIRSRKPVSWARDVAISASRPASSLYDASTALCIPMLYRGEAIGVIYLDSTRLETSFDQVNLDRLGETANLMASFIVNPAPGMFTSFPSVFVSYAAPDREFVDRLAADLRRRQIRVWFDERLQVGQVRRTVIEQVINSTGAFVLVLSPDSVQSEDVRWEIDVARQAAKTILPLIHRSCTPPDAVQGLHALDFETDPRQDNLEKLTRAINRASRPDVVASARMRQSRMLFLAANPRDQGQLRLAKEHRVIKHALRAAEYGDQFEIEFAGAVRPRDLQDHLRRYKPHIVHFSGHGGSTSGRIILEDDDEQAQAVPTPALNQLFRIFNDNIRCVVLNACLSESQAEAIKEEVGCVVGMSAKIDDEAAITFADSFYRTLGDGGSVQQAFEAGCNLVAMEKPGDETIPQLLTRADLNPARMFFV